MERLEIKKIISEDIDNIMNMDLDNMSSEEIKKAWQKHLRHLDGCKISQAEEFEIRREIVGERGLNFKIEFEKKLSLIISNIMNK